MNQYVSWITDSDLGEFTVTHDFTADPVLLQYIASSYSSISLVAGSIPPGLSWQATDGYVTITGIPSPQTLSTVYAFTFRISDIGGVEVDRQFTMQMLSSPVPVWLDPSELGTYPATHSFNIDPILINYAADIGAVVTLINGALPQGLSYQVSPGVITVTGLPPDVTETLDANWTMRIRNPNGSVTDRTFYIHITPIVQEPSWAGQATFLGYVGGGKTGYFKVVAKSPTSVVPTYSLTGIVPAGMSIDSLKGIITYSPAAAITDFSVSFIIRASLPGASADLSCSIAVLSIPHLPVWTSPIATITLPQEYFLEQALVAFDPAGNTVTYSLLAADDGFPFIVDSQGLLYGKAPKVTANQSWSFTIAADTIVGTTYNTQTVTVTKTNAPGVLSWREPIDQIELTDGQQEIIDVSAVSTRTRTVKHGITGGQCPPGLVLDKIQGALVGFLDYHMVDKDYWFELSATDNIDTIVRTIHIHVTANWGYQFSSINIPLWGDAKQAWVTEQHTRTVDPSMQPNVAVTGDPYVIPSMSLIRGLDSTLVNPDVLTELLSDQRQRMVLTVGAVGNVVIDSRQDQLIYRNVIDPQSGAGNSALENGSSQVIYPPSLENLRKGFISAFGYANQGLGSDASAIAFINPEDGSLSSVSVISSGSGYQIRPHATVVGTGSGASIACMMCVDHVAIIDAGSQWQLGETVYLAVGGFETPAKLIVTSVGTNGKLLALYVSNPGIYKQIPVTKFKLTNATGGYATVKVDLGVCRIDVLASGKGYDWRGGTEIIIGGTEILDSWQSQWEPILPMMLVTPLWINEALGLAGLPPPNEMDGVAWQLGDIIQDVEGAFWQGSTTFDEGAMTWDGGTTGWQETLDPHQTLIDQNITTFDEMGTTLDVGPAIGRDARDNWGHTLIDEGLTAFEFYATIFDAVAPPRVSKTLVRRRIRLHKPQISGNNVTDAV